jgi:outer membrane lipoprotein-sorting protein
MKNGFFRLLLPALLLTLLLPAASLAGEEEARKLLVESESRHRSETLEYGGELTVYTKEGKTRAKGWKSYREGYAGDAKVLVRFTSPPEVKGVSFLSLSRVGKNADQWLYLPSMKRERRIASQDRDASFVGTDFSYEDMEEFDHRRYEVDLKGETVLEGVPCYLIEAIPSGKDQKSVYAKRMLYLRKDILYLARVDLYKEGDKEPSKLFLISDIAQVGAHYMGRKLEMSDLKKGSRTTVILKDIVFDKPQPQDRFTLKNLNREGGE